MVQRNRPSRASGRTEYRPVRTRLASAVTHWEDAATIEQLQLTGMLAMIADQDSFDFEYFDRKMPATPIIDLIKVSKSYNKDAIALDDISLRICKGEIVFLSGMSGTGKTTILSMMCGMEKPSRGVVEIAGHNLAKLNEKQFQRLRQKIGVAYQEFRLLPHLTAFENIAMAMEVAYKNYSLINKRVSELLNLLMLEDKISTKVCQLSRGEQQRVAIARAAANAPPIILADEPTGNLDRKISQQVMALFQQLNDGGSTIVIATHDETIYENSPHKLIELRQGQLITVRPGPNC